MFNYEVKYAKESINGEAVAEKPYFTDSSTCVLFVKINVVYIKRK